MPDYSWIPKTPGTEPKPEKPVEKWGLMELRWPPFTGGWYRSPYVDFKRQDNSVTHTVNGKPNVTLRQYLKKQCDCLMATASGPRMTIKGPKVEGEKYTYTGQMHEVVCDKCDTPWKWETIEEESKDA